jgi:hypothetical protein
MSPRAAASRDDATAHHFLNAAASLIDQAFASPAERGRHPTNAMHFPAALDWLRIEDVVRCARQRGDGAVSRKALQNRWPDKDSFVRDAVVHALIYADAPEADPAHFAGALTRMTDVPSPAAAMAGLCEALLDSLIRYPRSYLLLHLAPFLDQHTDLHRTVVNHLTISREPWYAGYAALLDAWGLAFRPGWTVERFGLTLQAMLDGFLLRTTVESEFISACGWRGASLFADSVVAITIGVMDSSKTELTVQAAFDAAVHRVNER